MTRRRSKARVVRTWDMQTRLFHWLLVLALVAVWVSVAFGAMLLPDLARVTHRYAGLAVLVLTVARALWGFVGGSTARWSACVWSPSAAVRYGYDMLRGRRRPFLGHSPLGGYLSMIVLAGPGIAAMTGLVGRWRGAHAWFAELSLLLVAMHVAAVLIHQIVTREPVLRAMVTGEKPAARYEDGVTLEVANDAWLRAILCLAAAIGVVSAGNALFGDRTFP